MSQRRPTDIPEREAAVVPPWRPEHGPQPHVLVYQPAGRPGLWIYVAGQWRGASVYARHDAPGYTAYQVEIQLNPQGSTCCKYRWDGAVAVRPWYPPRWDTIPRDGRPSPRSAVASATRSDQPRPGTAR